MSKGYRRLLFCALFALALPNQSQAQSQDQLWNGFHYGIDVGLTPQSFKIANNFNSAVQQVSNVTVQGRGIVVVPSTLAPGPSGSQSQTSPLGGFRVGFGHRIDRWALGVEGGLDVSSGSVTFQSDKDLGVTLLTPVTHATSVRTMSRPYGYALTGRAGYLWNEMLIFGAAGFSGAHINMEGTNTWTDPSGGPGAPNPGGTTANLGPLGPNVNTTSQSKNQIGPTFGFGVERPFRIGMTIGIDYRHTNFGDVAFPDGTSTTTIQNPPPGTIALPGLVSSGQGAVSASENRVAVRISKTF